MVLGVVWQEMRAAPADEKGDGDRIECLLKPAFLHEVGSVVEKDLDVLGTVEGGDVRRLQCQLVECVDRRVETGRHIH